MNKAGVGNRGHHSFEASHSHIDNVCLSVWFGVCTLKDVCMWWSVAVVV